MSGPINAGLATPPDDRHWSDTVVSRELDRNSHLVPGMAAPLSSQRSRLGADAAPDVPRQNPSPPHQDGAWLVCPGRTVGNAIRNAINARKGQGAGPGPGGPKSGRFVLISRQTRGPAGDQNSCLHGGGLATHAVTRCAYIVHIGQCASGLPCWMQGPRAGGCSRAAWICKREGGGRPIASGPVQRTSIPLAAPMRLYLRHPDTGTRQKASNCLG